MTSVQVDLNSETEGWRIGNELIECRVRVVAGELVWQVTDLTRDRVVIPASNTPHLEVDRNRVLWGQPSVTAEEQPDGSTVMQCETETDDGIRLTRSFQVWPGFPFVRTWGVVENRRDEPFTVTAAEILNLTMPSARTG